MMINNKHNVYLNACLNGDLNLIKKSLANLTKQDIENIRDESKASCIHYAARNGHIKILDYLVKEKKVSINLESTVGATLLHDAAANGQVLVIEWALKISNMKITQKDLNGATTLHLASKYGQKRFIEWYFKCFDSNDASLQTNNGTTCLHFACASGSLSCVKLIANAAPNTVNVKRKHGLTPIYLAVQGKNLDIVKLLVNEYKASIYERDQDGMSLLHVACQNGSLDVLKWLIESQRFDVDDKDFSGATGLHYCCSNGHSSLVIYLLSRNAQILVDNDGGTPLHDCAANNQVECARLLLTNNCNVNILDKDNLTPYMIARDNGFIQLANEIKLFEDKSSQSNSMSRSNLYIENGIIDHVESVNNEDIVTLRKLNAKNKTDSDPYSIIDDVNLAPDSIEAIVRLDEVIDAYDDIDSNCDICSETSNYAGKNSIRFDTDSGSYIDLNNINNNTNNTHNHEAQLENPGERSTWFPSPPPETLLAAMNAIVLRHETDEDKITDSVENHKRLSTQTITNSSTSSVSSVKDFNLYSNVNKQIKYNEDKTVEVKNDAEQPVKPPPAPPLLLNNFDEANKKSIIPVRKGPLQRPPMEREQSLIDELNNRLVNNNIVLKKVANPNQNAVFKSYGQNQTKKETKENEGENNKNSAQDNIPAWKKQLIERNNKKNKTDNKDENVDKKVDLNNNEPPWAADLARKKKENLIKKLTE